jgi:EpsI family protein
MKSSRFWTIIVLLLATTFVLQSRGDTDRVPSSQPLSQMPETIGTWTARDYPLDDATLAVLGKGDFLNRVYVNQRPASSSPNRDTSQLIASSSSPISLFIGYFPTQRTGQTMHSPQNCLPGAGWTFDSKQYVDIKDVNGKTFRVGEYLISDGEIKQFVIYWYQAHGRSIPNEYIAKLHMVTDAIRTNRTDGAIVRVITQIQPNEPFAVAKDRAIQFTRQMTPNLPRFIPN